MRERIHFFITVKYRKKVLIVLFYLFLKVFPKVFLEHEEIQIMPDLS